jgi:hypothetical protein
MQAESTIDAARERANGGFFTFHGPWAPGVRLFRKLSFAAKAGLISATFTVPLLVLGVFFYGNLATQIDFSSKERLGVDYTRALGPLVDAGQQWRAGSGGTGLLDGVQKAAAQVQALDQRLGAELGTTQLHANLAEALRATAAAPTAATADTLVKAANALLVQATDGSNLTLDPDIDSYYLMDGSLFRLPDLIDQAAALRDLAARWPPPATRPPNSCSAWARCWRSSTTWTPTWRAGWTRRWRCARPSSRCWLPTRRASSCAACATAPPR